MIKREVVDQLLCSTCAVCYLTVPPEQYAAERDLETLRLVGTGFLIEPTVAITNRHVLFGLREEAEKEGVPPERWYLWFVYPTGQGRHEGYCRIRHHGVVLNEAMDIGLMDFVRRPEREFDACQPLTVPEEATPGIGDAIAVCGFPYGVKAMERDGNFYRVGPVIQQGYVSGLAPWSHTNASTIDEIVLDTRTAGGMSGAPVVRASDGTIIGVHASGIEATMAFAVPIDQRRLAAWLEAHDATRS